MKYLIVSDIHGCLPALEKVLQFYQAHHFDMLIILGDILNYGPRNGLPEGLNPKGIAEKLNEMAGEIVAIRGNCDSEVDQMLLNFPILSDYTLIVDMMPFSTDIPIYGNWKERQTASSVTRAPLLSPKEATLPLLLAMKMGKSLYTI